MLLFLLSIHIASKPHFKNFVEFTPEIFKSVVLNRTHDSTWAVLFHSNLSDPSRVLRANFVSAYGFSNGVLRFGILNVDLYPQLAEECNVFPHEIPKIVIYHKNGVTEYVGSRKPEDMYARFYTYLPNLAHKINESWIENNRDRTLAVLFTRNTTFPANWRAIAGHFKGTSVQIGFSTSEDIFNYYDIGELPCIMFYNKTHELRYEGPPKFVDIKEAIEQFDRGAAPPSKPPPPGDFLFSDEFSAECIGGRTLCVAIASDELDSNVQTALDETKNSRVRWFFGLEWPFTFIKPGTMWVINPRKMTASKVPKISLLPAILEAPNSSEILWKPIVELENIDL